MFHHKTLFIVGAGASKEFDLPVGQDLADTISRFLNVRYNSTTGYASGDPFIWNVMKRNNRPHTDRYLAACRLVAEGVHLSSSIDDFLDIHRRNKFVSRVGKAAIVRAILEAERSSKLYVDDSKAYNRLNMEPIKKSWIMKFVRMLSRNVRPQNVD